MKFGTKRSIVLSLLTAALLMLMMPQASANGWGLKNGRLLSLLLRVHTWDEYTTRCDEAGDYALMGARYHNALFYAGADGQLYVYTKAVYQPGEKKERPKIEYKQGRLTLYYGENERYRFCDALGDGVMTLDEAHIGDFHLALDLKENEDGYAYRAQQDKESAVLVRRITLDNFNIRLLPRSLKEVKHHNYMQARMDSALECLGTADTEGHRYGPEHWGTKIKTKQKGTAPVFSAPYEGAWRAAKGKAAVGLQGDVWQLFTYKNEQGQSYACIRYFVSERTQRIGYVRCLDAGLPKVEGEQDTHPGTSFARVSAKTARATYLTDDPDVSEFRQFEFKKGTPLTVLGLYDDDYAYVQIKNIKDKAGKSVSILWGFVPVRDIAPDELPDEREAMQKLIGSWTYYAGGSMADDRLTFREDGTFNDGGTYHVTPYDAKMNLYWNDPPYELTLLYKDGRATVRGLVFDEEGFSLTYWEGGGGYRPFDATLDDAPDGANG